MSDPADKSDDLIAELAKLMAASPAGPAPGVAPVGKPSPLDPAATNSPPAVSPQPVRIPGMDLPRQATAAAPASPAPRGPVTGAIRIPGMDAPAPVATSAPVSKFDFGSKPAAAPIKQEPLSTLSERLAPQNPLARTEPSVGAAPTTAAPIRIPSDLKPISENRSFAEGPAVTVSRTGPAPAAPATPTPAPQTPAGKPASDFNFDFGFGRNPPPSASPPRPTPSETESEPDPIADLIAAELGDEPDDDTPAASPVRPVSATPVPVPRAAVPVPAQARPAIAQASPAPQKPSGAQPVPLKPVSVAPRAPETDRFAVSPGDGIGARPPVSQPPASPTQRAPEPSRPAAPVHSDPMSEIESLIGEAVRVELSPPGPIRVQAVPQVAPHVELDDQVDDEDEDHEAADEDHDEPSAKAGPAPVVPPLGTQFAPRRSGLKDEGAASAEDAILAAAAATGASVDHIDPPMGEESPYRRLKVKPARSSWSAGGVRQYVGMAVAGTLLLAAGLGLYWVLNMGRGADVLSTGADAPQLTADATPVKEVPSAQPSAADTETARSPVLQQIDGASAEPSVEQLVSTDETAGEAVPRDVTQVAATDTEGGLANRKVRTVTVRPDGTIVSGDDAVAGAEALPVDRPNVPEVPSSGETTNLLDDTTSVAAIDTSATTTSTEPLTPAAGSVLDSGAASAFIDPTAVAPTPMQFPVRSVASAATRTETTTSQAQEPSPISLTGAQTPNGQIDLLGGTIEQPRSVASAAPVDSGNAAAYVQLSSSPSQADAQASLRTLTSRFGSLFGGTDLVIQSADLGQKGTWYRVKYPAGSLADAQSVCANIKANGGDCIVSGR